MPRQQPPKAENIPSGVKPRGPCGLCIGPDNNKRVWTIRCAAFIGDVCDGHLELLVKRQNGNEIPEATLFTEKAS